MSEPVNLHLDSTTRQSKVVVANQSDDQDAVERHENIKCRFCQTVITQREFAIEIAGQHQHRFINPAGLAFQIGCYSFGNCTTTGDATYADTWFIGYQWQIAICIHCGQQLGWLYQSSGSRFYGLILNRLQFSAEH